MWKSSPEQLLLLAIFFLVPLLNFFLAVWRRWQRAGTAGRQLEPVAPEAPAQETLRVGVSGHRPRRETLRVPGEAPPGPPRLEVSARLGPRDARRGVVLMAILGPCRGLDPPIPEARDSVAPGATPL